MSSIKIQFEALQRLTEDFKAYHPRAVVLFGSLARFVGHEEPAKLPNDIDLLVVGDNPPFQVQQTDYGCKVEINLFRVEQFVNIAKSLRYDPKPLALAKLYSKNVAKQHARDVIAACLLLGPTYNQFGIEQIELEGRIDQRDYSVHRVLLGKEWWRRITAYARERRGTIGKFSDKLVHNYDFEA